MRIENIFLKPIDRRIEGVIKADDKTNLINEIEEYVITSDIRTKLSDFIDAYLSEDSSNGVWVSGFFGSGKSHLLKMLSMLLEDWREEDCSIVESFIEKCRDDAFLAANIPKAAKIPSESILFNIDQKADHVTKDQSDTLLSVFAKVFDEHCGYFGNLGFIARFERDLDKNDIYHKFKQEYESISGKDWETGREEYLFESANITNAYQNVSQTNIELKGAILDRYREDYSLSIEDFANQVWEYIQTKEPNFRLNFFVDEVGQFIADNVNLMLNLQTISESLYTICKGRAWIVVTSQEELDSIVGEMSKGRGNDFSKITDRFNIRLELTSQNVDEVIQKRLLQKKEEAKDGLSKMYYDHRSNFRTLFDFVDGAQTYRNFEDKEEFVNYYPFIIYQFTLFQNAIKALSVNNAFQGRYRSVGERSMLSVFQQVVKNVKDKNMGQIATFDLMFDGIRPSIKGQIQSSIFDAEKHLDHPLALEVLKILFMMKYVESFRGTVNNISILLIDSFDVDIVQLRKKVQEALGKLEQQTFIQRNVDLYEYLTNEEKDVENQIKNTSVDRNDMLKKIDELIFSSGEILRDPRIRYYDNEQDFNFSHLVDGRLYNREYEMMIHVITQYYEHYDFDNDSVIMSHALGKPELTILLPSDKRFWDDLKIAMQTDKCYDNIYNSQLKESARTILSDKKAQNRERYINIKNRLATLISEAKFYIGGDSLKDTAAADAAARIRNAFQNLVAKVYPNLAMLKSKSFNENDIARNLDNSQMIAEHATQLSEAEQEVFSHLNAQERMSIRNTIRDITEKFEKKPYGWGLYAILSILAKLHALGKIDFLSDGMMVLNGELERSLKNTQKHGVVVIRPLQEYTASQIRRLKDLYQKFFHEPAKENDAKSIANEMANKMKELNGWLKDIIEDKNDYPFQGKLKAAQAMIQEASDKHHPWYYDEMLKLEDDYLKVKLEQIDPIRVFLASGKKVIYDNARQFMTEQELNFDYLDADRIKNLKSDLNDPEIHLGNKAQKLKDKHDYLADRIKYLIEKEKEKASKEIDDYEKNIKADENYADAAPEIKNEIEDSLRGVRSQVKTRNVISAIKDAINRFADSEYYRLLNLLIPEEDLQELETIEKESERLYIRRIRNNYPKDEIKSETELSSYIQAMNRALLQEIRKGNIIILKEEE